MKGSKVVLYLVLVLLFLSDNPFGRGWVQTGDFIPRAVIMLVLLSVLIVKKNFTHKSIVFLLLFFLYQTISLSMSGGFDIIGEVVSFAGFFIPMALYYSFVYKEDISANKSLYGYIVGLTFVVAICTIRLQIIDPSSLKHMVALSSLGDMSAIYSFQRQGMAGYDFAAMMMTFPPVYITLIRESKTIEKRKLFVALIISIAFVLLSQVTTVVLICAIISVFALFVSENYNNRFIIRASIILLIAVLIFEPFLELISPYFAADSDYGSKIGDLMETNQTGQMAGQVEGRVGLYTISLNSFLTSPIWGDANASIGGHAYFLDRLALYGLIGCAFLFLSFYYMIKDCAKALTGRYKATYYLCVAGLVVLGFLKNLAGMDYWLFSFFFIPYILYFNQLKKIQQKKIYKR